MRRIGTVVRTAQGLAVLRAEPVGDGDDGNDGGGGTGDDSGRNAIGTMVLDDSLETVGRVVDVFGPVDRPYLAVTPQSSVHLPGLVGSTLYAR
ncbi:H/ACA ribonucleoprotein complex subunit GAR1 [Natronosalvus halobius]|uniref:H/ACA ribonucleoprotein complex subunit GAR1 n=1 Tax=Natronosalvus halobius TaxID=2953746 RepID=UPI0020A1DFAC|nr:Gar1/Naf1 family protein [Natronosalvus halobius]USZ72923.1 Gar1/Naf1 family protein [Natronosalvus halobius]